MTQGGVFEVTVWVKPYGYVVEDSAGVENDHLQPGPLADMKWPTTTV
jgi:hypothetical protein